jgi:hypothetical protein
VSGGPLPTAPAFLARAQQRLWRLIASPEGVRTALADEPPDEPLAALIQSDGQLSAEDRLDVYANAYFYRILEVLQQDFPTLENALEKALGETAFHDLATSYLAVHPSENPSLRWIGGRLPGFLESHRAALPFRKHAPWAADLAAFEWAMGEVFDAADRSSADRESLATRAPADWDSLPLVLAPAVRLLRLRWPVPELCAARRDERTLPLSQSSQSSQSPLSKFEPCATDVCIWRHDERAFHRTLDRLEADALAEVQRGIRFGRLCEQLAQQLGDSDAPGRAAGWLARWIDDGLLLPFAECARDL